MKTQHTPGPWNVLHVETRELKTDHFVHQFQVITPNTVEHDNGIGQATARLIAAAPELLEALEEAKLYISEVETILGECAPHITKCINDAIKKAKGE